MAFRDDNVALRAKIQTLEEELSALRGEAAEGAQYSPDAVPPPPPTLSALPRPAALAEMVAQREAAEANARRASLTSAERARKKRAARYAKRPRRVTTSALADRVRVHIRGTLMRDAFLEDAFWHLGFLFINPGFFVIPGIAALLVSYLDLEIDVSAALGTALWATILLLGHTLYSRLKNPSYTIDRHHDGYFAVYANRSRKPVLMGRGHDLRVDIRATEDDELGWGDIGDSRSKISLKKLSPADVAALRAAFSLADR